VLDLKGKNVLVMGLGVHGGGLGVTRFLVSRGANVTVTDLQTAEQLQSTLAALEGLPIRYVLGEHHVEDFLGADMVVRNPGVPRESKYLALVREKGIPVEMEMSLFFELCPAPIIGITGTKGKTTSTLLLGEILRRSRPDTVVAGNLRVSALEALPLIKPDTPVVLELSSWQLEAVEERGLAPHVAAVTNVFPDHLNRYPDMVSYAEAKKAIFRHQQPDDVLILNADDPIVRGFAQEAKGRVVWFGQDGGARRVDCLARGFRILWREDQTMHVVCSTFDIHLLGEHNLGNVLAAVAIAKTLGIPSEQIRAGILGFTGVPDRLELVRQLDGISYYNDTTSTTPVSTVAALKSFHRPVVLIAGGSEKNLGFEELAEAVGDRVKCLVALEGTATPRLLEAVKRSSQVPILGPFSQFRIAVEAARKTAADGDIVLLSPACASFGMFRNEFDRGEQFRQIVSSL
jgi:UDP-N-acetylmuramoylalanine--D-glutamate ligase